MVEQVIVEKKAEEKKEVPQKADGSRIFWLFAVLFSLATILGMIILVNRKLVSLGQVLWGVFALGVLIGMIFGLTALWKFINRKRDLVQLEKIKPLTEVDAQNYLLDLLSKEFSLGGMMVANDKFCPEEVLKRGVIALGKGGVEVFRLIFKERGSNVFWDLAIRLDNRKTLFQKFGALHEFDSERSEAENMVNQLAGFSKPVLVKRHSWIDNLGTRHDEEERIPYSQYESVKEEKEGELQ
jgi:hypothetical protein